MIGRIAFDRHKLILFRIRLARLRSCFHPLCFLLQSLNLTEIFGFSYIWVLRDSFFCGGGADEEPSVALGLSAETGCPTHP